MSLHIKLSEKVFLKNKKEVGDNAGAPLAVIIKNMSSNRDSRHTGFMFFGDDAGFVRLAHLGWKHYYCYDHVKYDDLKYAFYWLFQIEPAVLVPCITKLMLLHQAKTKINYSFIPNTGNVIFDGTGKYIRTVKGDGFTCATFVMFMLDIECGFNLIDMSTWVRTQEEIDSDSEWNNKVIHMIAEDLPADKIYYLDELKEAIGLYPRIKPEHVVGACCIFEYEPLSHEQVKEAAKKVLDELDRLGC